MLPSSMPVRKVAAIDLGTNSLRLLIAECSADRSYRIVGDEKFPTRLGEGMTLTGTLSEAAMARTIDGLRRAQTIAQGHGVHITRAVATSAVRDAVNGSVFVDRVKEQLGLTMEVISGEDEARLAYLSLRRHFDLSQEPSIVTDLGGGSFEALVAARDELVEDIVSLPLGAVRLTEEFLPDPVISSRQYRRLRQVVSGQLEEKLGEYRGQGHRVYGSGGCLTSLGRMLLLRRQRPAAELMGLEIPRPDLRHIREILQSLPLEERRKVPGLSANRADIMVAAAVVLEETLRTLAAESITVNAQGIREGLLLRTMEQIFGTIETGETSSQRTRSTSVRAFARSCHFDEPHAEHVRSLALAILEQLPLYPDGVDHDEARILLEAAALLHDIGQLVRYEGHHKHSHHLISHAELAGFTPRRLALVAAIARFHTGTPPKKKHPALVDFGKSDRRLARFLAGILRLADALDRCHCQRVRAVRLEKAQGPSGPRPKGRKAKDDRKARAQLIVWAEADSNPELELWAAQRKVDLLSKILRADIHVHQAGPRPVAPP